MEESAENEAFVVARIYTKKDRLRPGDRALATKLLTILGSPKPPLPGLVKVGFKRGEPGHHKDQIVETYAKQECEDPEELKLFLPETEKETSKALEHQDQAWKRAHRED